MSTIIVNKNTRQTPNTLSGATGVQSTRFIPAGRVYVKTADPITAGVPVIVKSSGATPTGWTDLGVVLGNIKVTYNKTRKEIRTGIDKVLRYVYIDQKEATLEADLGQVDDLVLTNISGLTASTITSGSIVSFGLGQEDIVEMAILCVNQNKVDGKEFQFYNPAAKLDFEWAEAEDGWALKLTAELPIFTCVGQTAEELMRTTIFA